MRKSDPRCRTRVLYRTEDGRVWGIGATPATLEILRSEAVENGITILNEKPFVIGEDFTEEEIKCAQAA